MTTDKELNQLKESWKRDPIWDIEDTCGFEEHHDELLEWRRQYEAEQNKRYEEGIARRARTVQVETGISNASIAQDICTYGIIEGHVAAQDRMIDELDDKSALVQARLKQNEIRALLLLAAQVQRVADALEEGLTCDDGDEIDLMTRLYNIK